jgi:2,4-diketo-3-deoxy-L-fuconate hydrolase
VRFVNVAGRTGVLRGEFVADVHEITAGRFGPSMQSCLTDWPAFLAVIDDSLRGDVRLRPLEPELLGPPVPEPRQIFAIGLNYRDHAEETGSPYPEHPVVFTKFVSSLTGPNATVALPSNDVDFEAELVVVLGATARNVVENESWSHVAGLMVGQDLSERTVQTRGGAAQWSLGKSFTGFGPTGPALVTLDELVDADDLAITCRVDTEVLQSSRTSHLIFSVPQLIAYLSSVLTLYPGDLVFTGTPAGVGLTRKPPRLLRGGETLVTEIEGLGLLNTTLTTDERL